jgi:hypothetical protein
MLKDIMSYLDASFCAEVACVIFFTIFFLVLVRTIFTSKAVANRQGAIPLSDGTPVRAEKELS